jgi:uncharacterized protein YbbK (DUF523 family)
MDSPHPPLYLVSACLVGLCTRYDAQIRPNLLLKEIIKTATWIPICPEQLGGLPTPRPPADIIGGEGSDVLAGKAKVQTREGTDVSEAFIEGAYQVLTIAESQPVTAVMLKSRSPSCGHAGVTTALLRQHGFRLFEF